MIVSSETAQCGPPWVPPHGQLTCKTDRQTKTQICVISCVEPYKLALADPLIRCSPDAGRQVNLEKDPEKNIEDNSVKSKKIMPKSSRPQWKPHLDEQACQAPAVGKSRKDLTLEYECVCSEDATYLQNSMLIFGQTLRKLELCTRYMTSSKNTYDETDQKPYAGAFIIDFEW